ncbi:MAG TPA: glucodextranase DOMON-like domain-containing protein, partial [Anaerolineae bacterium]
VTDNFVSAVQAVRQQLKADKAPGPHLVTVVLDGEQLLGRFADNGQTFLNTLYKRLSELADQYEVQTITPSEYLTRFPGGRELTSKVGHQTDSPLRSDMSAWIGATATNNVWSNLGRARKFLNDYLTGVKSTDKAALNRAYDSLLLAESSDWLRSDADRNASTILTSPDTAYYDRTFRELLGSVYTSVGAPIPEYLQLRIQPPATITGDHPMPDVITPTIDGLATDGEWNGASVILASNAPGTNGGNVISRLYMGANADNLFFRIDARDDWIALAAGVDSPQTMRVGVYIAKADATASADFTRLGGDGEVRVALGASASHLLEWTLDPDGSMATVLYSANASHGWAGTATLFTSGAAAGHVLEMSAPRKALGGVADLSKLTLVVIVTRGGQLMGTFPANGIAQMTVPATKAIGISTSKVIGDFDDPVGDDNGTGKYTYPSNAVFEPGTFDLKHVSISISNKNLLFKITLNGPINNVWNSLLGLSLQTFDIYIDKDPGKGTGARRLLAGRNATLAKGNGWEYALWVEGWQQQLFNADARGKVNSIDNAHITVEVDPAGCATIAVPLEALGNGSPEAWGYAIAVLGQEAFPTDGVLRVRDVDPTASEWHFGGSADDTNHTRIIDFLNGAASNGDNSLSHYTPSTETDLSKLPDDAFGSIPLVTIGK